MRQSHIVSVLRLSDRDIEQVVDRDVAVAALWNTLLAPRALNGMIAVRIQAFDCGNWFGNVTYAVMHNRTASLPTCTVQAPHWAIPHPYFVPVRPITSRRTHSSGVSGGTSTV